MLRYGREAAASLIPALAFAAALPCAHGQNSFATGQTTLAYSVFGEGPPLVLLAGGPGMNPAYVTPLAEMLAACGRRVILFHQRGTGRSEAAIVWKERMTLSGAVRDLEDLRKHLGLDRLTLAGHSWGGMLAMAYAQEHPDRVAGMLLIDSGPMSSQEFPRENAAETAALTPAERNDLRLARQNKDAARIEAMQTAAEFARRDNVGRLQEAIPNGQPLFYGEAGQLLGRDLGGYDVRRGMSAFAAPLGLLYGRLDPGFFIAGTIRRLHPQAQLIEVGNAGHYPWLENRAETERGLKSLLTELP